MLTLAQVKAAQIEAQLYFAKAGIALTDIERETIEVSDFNLNDLRRIGLELIVYVNTNRVCAKEIVLFPRQTCPQHIHPTHAGIIGKEETFRCRWGKVHLYVQGEKNCEPFLVGLEDDMKYFNVFHEIILYPGQQYTLAPDTWHWFRAGDEGAVVSEFSTTSTDLDDVFSDPRIMRVTKIAE